MDVVDEYLHGVPAAPLQPYIPWYSGYQQRGLAPGEHRGLPSPWVTLIFTLDEPMVAAALPEGAPGGSYDTYLGGLHRTPALLVHNGAQSASRSPCPHSAAAASSGYRGGELAGQNLSAEDVLGRVRGGCGNACGRPRAGPGVSRCWITSSSIGSPNEELIRRTR